MAGTASAPHGGRESRNYYADDGTFRVPEAHVELFVPADGDPVLSVGRDGDGSAPLSECTPERQSRTIRWAIRRIVLNEDVYQRLTGLTPVATRIGVRGGPEQD